MHTNGRCASSTARATCSALTQVGSRRAVPYLVRGLDHSEEDLRMAAWTGLKSITGRTHPPERRVWSEAFGL